MTYEEMMAERRRQAELLEGGAYQAPTAIPQMTASPDGLKTAPPTAYPTPLPAMDSRVHVPVPGDDEYRPAGIAPPPPPPPAPPQAPQLPPQAAPQAVSQMANVFGGAPPSPQAQPWAQQMPQQAPPQAAQPGGVFGGGVRTGPQLPSQASPQAFAQMANVFGGGIRTGGQPAPPNYSMQRPSFGGTSPPQRFSPTPQGNRAPAFARPAAAQFGLGQPRQQRQRRRMFGGQRQRSAF